MPYKPTWHLSGPPPYAVQLEAQRRAHDQSKYAFFLEQGLGKTALQLNDYIEQHSDLDTIVLLCPNTFKQDWVAAPAEWGVPEIKGGYWPRDDMKRGTTGSPRINVMNFEAVRGSGHAPLAALMDKRPCLLVVDESSAIKNFKSQTAKAVLDLAKRAKAVRLLNGTPMSQNVMDLFPQLKALGQMDKINPYVFRNHFAVTGGWMGKQIVGVKNEEELHAILDRCSFRALKKDWSDLPEKINVPVQLEMTNKQLKHYKEMLRDFITLVSGHEFSADMVIARLEKLRQISSGLLMDGDKFTLLDEPHNNPKIKALLDIYESGPGKLVVVHHYTKMGSVLFDFLAKKGLKPSYLRGGMKPEEITHQKDRFNNDPDCRVKVAQILASSRAHTLIGGKGNDRANRMVYHDLTWNLLDKSQMDDRIHRGAQDKVCSYYHLMLTPVDKAQVDALTSKADLVSKVVDVIRAMKNG